VATAGSSAPDRLTAAAAQTSVVGVIGSPIRQSLSPLLHNVAFAQLGLKWVSVPFEVAAGQAGAALEGMRALGIVGLSVTMPHKAAVAALVDVRSDTATRLGAVNCVINRDGKLRGANTDGAGFLASLERAAGFDPRGKRCLVIGAGGAARAVAVALADAGASDIAVVNRTLARGAEVAAMAGSVGRVAEPQGEEGVAQAELVVNATPIGMQGDGAAPVGAGGAGGAAGSAGAHEEGAWPVAPTLLHDGQVVVDLIYAPRPTPWLAAAAAKGATTVDGLGMLVHQAAAQIELWTGLPAPVDVMWKAAALVG
jgi:shikimate dehydrogenase